MISDIWETFTDFVSELFTDLKKTKVAQFVVGCCKSVKDAVIKFIRRPSRKQLLDTIFELEDTIKDDEFKISQQNMYIRMCEQSRNFVESKKLQRYSFNVAISGYMPDEHRKQFAIDSAAEQIAEFLEKHGSFQVYEGEVVARGKYYPDDKVQIYHSEFWFQDLPAKATRDDYMRRQYTDGGPGFHLECADSDMACYKNLQ